MQIEQLKNILEAALLAAGAPLNLERLEGLFSEQEQPERQQLRAALQALEADYADRGIELVEVGNGYRIQSRPELSAWVSRLWEERPSRYTRALLETLALVAYRQPVTRAEIEDVRGVSVSSSIMRTLLDREWVRVVGYRDVPGKPGMYGTTRKFLDYFGLKNLDDLPTLAELRDILELNDELGFDSASSADAAPGVLPEPDDGDADTTDAVASPLPPPVEPPAEPDSPPHGDATALPEGTDRVDEDARE